MSVGYDVRMSASLEQVHRDSKGTISFKPLKGYPSMRLVEFKGVEFESNIIKSDGKTFLTTLIYRAFNDVAFQALERKLRRMYPGDFSMRCID